MSTSDLHQLPPELVTMVMCQMDSPRDLSALVRSARHIHGVFKRNEPMILTSVIRNAMPDGNIHSAVAACEALEVSQSWYAGQPTEALMDVRARSLQVRSQQAPPNDSKLRDQISLRSLYRLWWTTERFMQRFIEDASRWADRKFSTNTQDYNAEIHKVSLQRLQRAFFRFEIFRRIHPPTIRFALQEGRFVQPEEEEQVSHFLAQFPPWEREEMLSIHEFLISYTQDMVRESMDWMVRQISAKAQELSSQPGVVFEEEPLEKLLEAIDYDSCDIFQHDDGQGTQPFTFLVGRGLPFLEWLHSLPQNHRIDIIARATAGEHSCTLFENLYRHNDDFALADCKSEVEMAMNSIQDGLPSTAWQWVEKHKLCSSDPSTYGEENLTMRYELRRAGFFFWNDETPGAKALFTSLQPESLKLTPRHDREHDPK